MARTPDLTSEAVTLQLLDTSSRRRSLAVGTALVVLVGLLAAGLISRTGGGGDPAPVITEGDASVVEAKSVQAMPFGMGRESDPRWAVHRACMAANGFDVTAWEQRMVAVPEVTVVKEAPPVTTMSELGATTAPFNPASTTTLTTLVGGSEPVSAGSPPAMGPPTTLPPVPAPGRDAPPGPPAMFEPTVAEHAAALEASRACRGVEPGSKEQRAWYDCLDDHIVVATHSIPFSMGGLQPLQDVRRADAACRHLRPAVMAPTDAYGKCLDENGVWMIPANLDLVALNEPCKHLMPAPPMLAGSAEHQQCLFDTGFPRPDLDGTAPVDAAVARPIAAACFDIIGDTQDEFVNCMAEQGIYLNLPGPVAWPPEDERRAHATCQPLVNRVPAEVTAWFTCLVDHGANVVMPWDEPPEEPSATPLQVARQAMEACSSIDPNGGGVPFEGMPPEIRVRFEQFEACLDAAGVLSNFPGPIEGVDYEKAHERCQSLLPQPTAPTAPTAVVAWHECLAEHGLKAPYHPQDINLDTATKALDTCEHLEPSDGSMFTNIPATTTIAAPVSGR